MNIKKFVANRKYNLKRLKFLSVEKKLLNKKIKAIKDNLSSFDKWLLNDD